MVHTMLASSLWYGQKLQTYVTAHARQSPFYLIALHMNQGLPFFSVQLLHAEERAKIGSFLQESKKPSICTCTDIWSKKGMT